MAEILDGLKLSREIKKEIALEVEKIILQGKRAPHLVAILVGTDGASQTYVNNKIKDCKEVGFRSTEILFPNTISETELLEEKESENKIKRVVIQYTNLLCKLLYKKFYTYSKQIHELFCYK